MSTALTFSNEERTKCEIYQRAMGYHAPTSNLNIGKKQEFKERKNFTENIALNSLKMA